MSVYELGGWGEVESNMQSITGPISISDNIELLFVQNQLNRTEHESIESKFNHIFILVVQIGRESLYGHYVQSNRA